MEALSKLGLIGYIGGWTEALILRVDESDRLAVALILMVWVSGITSAFVDNVPLTTMMVRVVTSLGTHPTLNLPIEPLIWALSFGVCLGGNGTLIGASSNVVCVGLAEQHGYKITFMQFFKIGFPVMIGHLVVATAYLLHAHQSRNSRGGVLLLGKTTMTIIQRCSKTPQNVNSKYSAYTYLGLLRHTLSLPPSMIPRAGTQEFRNASLRVTRE
ncbi:hypothetical protein HW555_014146 [Spodoptera exigua]|uniref:Citrate transporter-like domain-containing protein n=1 Tax=Spodoptera exigua TaxID=7107 RepID=A0A835G2U0_SPOEX|nr:hypothetical protein HW555_014146 [Spodoptera exigua]